MEFLDLQNELNIQLNNARDAQENLVPNAVSLANLEKQYKIAKAKKVAELDLKGVAKTLISTYVEGDETVAELKRQLVIAEGTYDATKDKLNLFKLNAKMLNDEINREWNSGGYNNG